jgi:hypothetical protein
LSVLSALTIFSLPLLSFTKSSQTFHVVFCHVSCMPKSIRSAISFVISQHQSARESTRNNLQAIPFANVWLLTLRGRFGRSRPARTTTTDESSKMGAGLPVLRLEPFQVDVGRGQEAIISLNIAPELLKTRSIGPATYCELHNNRPKFSTFPTVFRGISANCPCSE